LWPDHIAADSIKEALEMIESILPDLKKLAQLEKEGKIMGECLDPYRCKCCDSLPNLQAIDVLDESIEPELKKINLVDFLGEYDDEDA
jgi:hypothetical protein